MSRQTRRLKVGGAEGHPADSVLLAFIRQQPFAESWSSLQQHIFECNECQQRYIDLTEISALLTDTLEHAQDAQEYPSLVANVLEVIQEPGLGRAVQRRRRETRLREDLAWAGTLLLSPLLYVKAACIQLLPWPCGTRARRSSMASWGAMSTMIALLLLAVVVVLAFTLTASAFGLLHGPGEVIPLPPQPTATSTSHAAASAGRPSPATPLATVAQLKLCTTSSDMSQSRMRICGSYFMPGDKVQVTVQIGAAQMHAQHFQLVDARGNFQDSWIVACKGYPRAVFVRDLTHPLLATSELQSAQLGQCSPPAPAAAAGP